MRVIAVWPKLIVRIAVEYHVRVMKLVSRIVQVSTDI